MIRNLLALPLLAWMSVLVLAAWPREIRPSLLDAPSAFAYETLESLGIRAGMPVFAGGVDVRRSVVTSRCIRVVGTDSAGREVPVYPPKPCPEPGFRWRPATYEHMLFHWMLKVRRRSGPSYLWAMADHFCRAQPDLASVEITNVLNEVDYETGKPSTRETTLPRVECRR